MTRKTNKTAELAWADAVRDIPQAGLSREREAAPDELAGIARALDLIACSSLKAVYTIVPTIDGRYQLSGKLRAGISQACVVTLEQIDSVTEERFDVAFWPQEDIPPPRSGVLDPDDELDPEPIVAGEIDVGRVVFECLATAIDPFPRRPGATLDWRAQPSGEAPSDAPESPFAVLERLKTKS